MKKLKIVMAQMRVIPADIQTNLAKMSSLIDLALQDKADAIVFPEMCLGGYLLGDRWADEEFCKELQSANQTIIDKSDELLILWGNLQIDKIRRNRDGRVRKYNALHAYYKRQPLKRNAACGFDFAIKTLQPNYRFFDDDRHFFSMLDLALEEGLDIKAMLAPFIWPSKQGTVQLGLEICEDLWSTDYSATREELNVSQTLLAAGADLIINASASPWTPHKSEARHRQIARSFAAGGVPFLYVNNVGTQNNGKNVITFDGNSTVYDKTGSPIFQAKHSYQECLLTTDFELRESSGKTVLIPVQPRLKYLQPEQASEPRGLQASGKQIDHDTGAQLAHDQYLAALEAIRSFDLVMASNTFPWIIGLSGGIDSAVVACLLVAALGPKRVLAFNLPSRYNSSKTREVAQTIARELGIVLHELPIEDLVAANCEALKPFKPSAFDLENIQAKIRGTSLLSNLAAIHGGLMINNGNKVEMALGYATLYGDVNGALAPIGDLLKTEVFALARFINAYSGKTIIPESIIPDKDFNFAIAPSAELRAQQVDPMKWGYHDNLLQAFCKFQRFTPEKALERWLEASLWEFLGLDAVLVERYQLNNGQVFVDDLEWFMKLFYRGVFKRIQAPPIVVMSRSAFGFDFRESQLPWRPSQRYLNLKKTILGQSLA